MSISKLSTLSFAFLCSLFTALSAQCPDLVWSDEFDGESLNTQDWNYDLGDGCQISNDLCGWGNQELQYYQSGNAVVADGKLSIIAKRETVNNRQYTSARITTKGKQDFRFGRLESRIKLPQGGGTWPAFWMLSTDEVFGGWPQSGEIDIMEYVGNKPEEVLGTIHYGNVFPGNQFQSEYYELFDEDFYEDYHDFAIEWEAGVIRWFVDDILYGTKRPADISPFNWPFDQDFHFILNLAIGGTLGGAVDNAIFPVSMDVDYVRVYDGNRPYLSGDREVDFAESGVIYRVGNLSNGNTVNWTVPAGATIVSGQGTAALVVDWGTTAGPIVATITTDCGEQTITLDTKMAPPFSQAFSFENFDDEPLAILEFTDGQHSEVSNPDPNEVNSSNLVGRYVRDGGTQFDVVSYAVGTISNANDYFNGNERFYIDVNTMAPVGTEILLQLETSSSQPTNFPTGRHSRYVATTTQQGSWERLVFMPMDQPDAGANPTAITDLILLFRSNTFTSDIYFYDNLDSYDQSPVSTRDRSLLNLDFSVSPNPARDVVNVKLTENDLGDARYDLLNQQGQIVRSWSAATGENRRLDIAELPQGLYYLRATVGNRSGVRKVLVE